LGGGGVRRRLIVVRRIRSAAARVVLAPIRDELVGQTAGDVGEFWDQLRLTVPGWRGDLAACDCRVQQRAVRDRRSRSVVGAVRLGGWLVVACLVAHDVPLGLIGRCTSRCGPRSIELTKLPDT
jgi:hypothetical protein